MECGMLNLNKGFLLLTYKMEYHDVARADREAGRLGYIYRISDKCRLFFIRREEESFIEQIKYYYTEQSPGDSRRTV